MILSASRRTDLATHFTPWLLARLRQGEVMVPNPMNRGQVKHLLFSPENTDCLVFWSKDPEPLLPHLSEIDRLGYRYGFQFTLTPYGKDLEPGLREKEAVEKTLLALGQRIPPRCIVWRYDPVVLTQHYTVAYHKERFTALCQRLSGLVDRVVFSFVDSYRGRGGGGIRPLALQEMQELGAFFGETARQYNLPAQTCCEEVDLTPYGVSKAGCLSRDWLEQVCGYPLRLKKAVGQRGGCSCVESVDIGMYHCCPSGCIYCYANRGPVDLSRLKGLHSTDSPLLLGTPAQLPDGCKITKSNPPSSFDSRLPGLI